jgi:hypothetical protein
MAQAKVISIATTNLSGGNAMPDWERFAIILKNL